MNLLNYMLITEQVLVRQVSGTYHNLVCMNTQITNIGILFTDCVCVPALLNSQTLSPEFAHLVS